MNMILTVGGKKRDFIVEPGMVQAALTHISDVGYMPDKFNPGKTKHTHALTFQIDRQYEIGGVKKNMTVDELYTLTLNERSNLYKLICGILGNAPVRGTTFDINSLIGKRIMLDLKQDGNFVRVAGAIPFIEGLKPMEIQDLPLADWIVKKSSDSNTAMR